MIFGFVVTVNWISLARRQNDIWRRHLRLCETLVNTNIRGHQEDLFFLSPQPNFILLKKTKEIGKWKIVHSTFISVYSRVHCRYKTCCQAALYPYYHQHVIYYLLRVWKTACIPARRCYCVRRKKIDHRLENKGLASGPVASQSPWTHRFWIQSLLVSFDTLTSKCQVRLTLACNFPS